jgi:hypothetical protein
MVHVINSSGIVAECLIDTQILDAILDHRKATDLKFRIKLTLK